MCITEYNEEETMQMFREEGREEGRVEGRAEGREEGIRGMIISMLERGKTPESIAEFCNIPIETVNQIQESMCLLN